MVEHAVDKLSNVRSLFQNIDIDQCLDDYAQNESLHLAREIDFHPRPPSVHCLSRVLNNHAVIVLDVPPGKGRLEEAALSIMIVAIGRQQPISPEHPIKSLVDLFSIATHCQGTVALWDQEEVYRYSPTENPLFDFSRRSS